MSGPLLRDREQAAELLAQQLEHYRGKRPVVIGIPRGAVPMARHIASQLGGELDVVLVRKLGAPGNREYALGAVDEGGTVYLNPEAQFLSLEEDYVANEVRAQLATIRERRSLYTPSRAPIPLQGRVVIVVDDGSATGATMLAALRAIRPQAPQELVAALAVAPPDTLQRLEQEADRVVVVAAPSPFRAVGMHFANFDQVSDAEVVAALQR